MIGSHIGVRTLVTVLVSLVAACSSASGAPATASDDSGAAAESILATKDASSGSPGDASVSIPWDALPPAVAKCESCMVKTCEPEISACYANIYCEELFTCVVEDGCLTDGSASSSCITLCGTKYDMTKKEIAEATVLIEAMVQDCTSCLTQCAKPDAG